jgi:3-dehydroquinate dehydratase
MSVYKVERKADLIILICGICGYRVVVKDKLEQLARAMIETHIKSVHKL